MAVGVPCRVDKLRMHASTLSAQQCRPTMGGHLADKRARRRKQQATQLENAPTSLRSSAMLHSSHTHTHYAAPHLALSHNVERQERHKFHRSDKGNKAGAVADLGRF